MSDEKNLFEIASKSKLRFASSVGDLTVEDLWDLPTKTTAGSKRPSLDSIAVDLHRQINDADSTILSFVNEKQASAEVDQLKLKFDIVRHILQKKVEEANAKVATAQKAQMKSKLRELIAEKEEDGLKSKTVEELQEMLKQID